MVSNMIRFYGEELLAPRPTQAGGTPLFGCPRLLIQYTQILSYPPHWRLFLHPQPEDTPCSGDKDQLITIKEGHNHGKYKYNSITLRRIWTGVTKSVSCKRVWIISVWITKETMVSHAKEGTVLGPCLSFQANDFTLFEMGHRGLLLTSISRYFQFIMFINFKP
jgi:hypothetical protein